MKTHIAMTATISTIITDTKTQLLVDSSNLANLRRVLDILSMLLSNLLSSV